MSQAQVQQLLTDHIDLWTGSIEHKSTAGRGSNRKQQLHGIKKLRELILELAVHGKLVPQDTSDEPAAVLLERIAAERDRLVKEKLIKKPKVLPEISEEEKPFELPVGWEWSRLNDLLPNFQNGASSRGDKDGKEITVLRLADIDKYQISLENTRNLQIDIDSADRYSLQKYDVLVIRVNGSSDIVGRFILCGKDYSAIYCDHFIRMRFQTKSISPKYLQVLSSAQLIRAQISELFVSTAGQKTVNQKHIGSLLITIPPLQEQHRIVAKVDELMALCDLLEQQTEQQLDAHQQLVTTLLDTLTQSQNAAELAANWARLSQHFNTLFTTDASIDLLKQTLLQLAVMGKLVPQEPTDEPASALLSRIAAEKEQLIKEKKIKKQKPLPAISDEEKPFELPEGWEWCRLQQLATLLGDGLHGTPTYDENGEYFFVNGNNLRNGEINIKPETKRVNISEYKKHRKELNSRTILVSINGTLGNVAFYAGEPVMLGKSACYFNLAPELVKTFFKCVIETPYFSDYANTSATGTTIKNLGLKAMNSLPIALPPIPEQHRIVTKVNELFALCDQLKQQLQQQQRTQLLLTDTLVQDALNR